MIYAYDYKSIRGEVDWCHYIIISQKFLCNALVTLADCEETLVMAFCCPFNIKCLCLKNNVEKFIYLVSP